MSLSYRKVFRATFALGLVAIISFVRTSPSFAQAINPKVHQQKFEESKKNAEVVAQVRVLSAVCSAVKGEGKGKTVTLELALQVQESQKGPLKKNEVIVVTHEVRLPTGPGPGAYGYMGEVRRFPFTPAVSGDVALRWDNDLRKYVAIAGWVEQPNGAAVPSEVGQAFFAADNAKNK